MMNQNIVSFPLKNSDIQVIYDAEAAIANVAAGHYAYYENIHYLHHAKVKEKLAEAAMKDNATGTYQSWKNTENRLSKK